MRTTKSTKVQPDTGSDTTRYTPAPNEKDNVVKELRKRGFEAEIDHSVVMVYYHEPGTVDETIKRLKEVLESIGFNGSYGAKFGKSKDFDRVSEEDFSPADDEDEDFAAEED